MIFTHFKASNYQFLKFFKEKCPFFCIFENPNPDPGTRVFKNQNPKPAFSKPEPGLKSQIRPIHLAISKVKIWKGVRSAV